MTITDLASATSSAGRKSLLGKGQAMPGQNGGRPRYPIPNVAFLRKAMRAIGRTSPAQRPAVRAYIKRRAKALGATSLLKNPVWQAASKTPDELLELATHYNVPIRQLSYEQLVAGEILLAGNLPVVSASDGPRVVSIAAAKLGLQPHQARAYARFRKKGLTHSAALKFAKRVENRANIMGTAAKIGSGPGNIAGGAQAYSRFSTDTSSGATAMGNKSTARGQVRGRRANRMRTDQRSILGPQNQAPNHPPSGSGHTEGGPRKSRAVRPGIMGVKSSSATPPGGKLLKQSAGTYNWPDNKGQGQPPRTPVSTYPGKLPTNLQVRTTPGGVQQPASNSAQRPAGFKLTGKAGVAYGKLRGMGISHAAAVKAINQYYGAGRPANRLGLNKGGNQTNLKMNQTSGERGQRTRSRGPKARAGKSMAGAIKPQSRVTRQRVGSEAWYGGGSQVASMSRTGEAVELAAATGNPTPVNSRNPGEPGVTARRKPSRGASSRGSAAGSRGGGAAGNPQAAHQGNPGEPGVTARNRANGSRAAGQGKQPGGPGTRKNVPTGLNVTQRSSLNQGSAASDDMSSLVGMAKKIGAKLTLPHLQAAASSASHNDYTTGVQHLSRAHDTARGGDGNVQLMNAILRVQRTMKRQVTP